MNTIPETHVPYQAKIRLNAIVELNLKPTYKKTLLTIDSFVNSTTGACFPSKATIAKRRGLSERATQYHLRKLEGLGLLERRARYAETGRQRSNTFIPSYVQLAHPYAGGVSDTGRRHTLLPPLPSFLLPLNQRVLTNERKSKERIPTSTETLQVGRSLYFLLQQFFDSPKDERGLLVHAYQWQAEQGSLDHQRVCDRMRWAWREEP